MGYLHCARLFMSTGGGELAQFLVFYTLLSHRLLLFRYRVPMYRIMAFSNEYQNGVVGQIPLPSRILRQGNRAYCTLTLSINDQYSINAPTALPKPEYPQSGLVRAQTAGKKGTSRAQSVQSS